MIPQFKNLLLIGACMFSCLCFAQQTITGTVTDAEGMPIPGVNVIEVDTNNGKVTDFDGNYSIEVAGANSILEFSFLGFTTTRETVGSRTTINAVLQESASGLDEVIVVGYGTQRKDLLTEAVSSIKSSSLENQQISRLENALQGRASGLTVASNSGIPGSAATVRVRGITSLNAGANEPLYVVDGVVVNSGGIDFLNPSDIKSIEVLKDAASAAIYGARSSAGVILVTTKTGYVGDLKINYNSYGGIQEPSRKVDLLNASQYATLINEQNVNSGQDPVFPNPESFGEGTDWQDQIFNNSAVIQNHELSLNTGNETARIYASMGYFNQEGIVATDISNFKRINARINGTYDIKDWLRAGHSIGYSHIKNIGGVGGNTNFGGPLSSAIMLDPITEILETDPTITNSPPYSNQNVILNSDGIPYAISNNIAQQVTNPLAFIETQRGNYNWSDDFVGNAYISIHPIEGLEFKSTFGGVMSYSGNENFTPVYYLNSNQDNLQNSFSRFRGKREDWNLENILTYEKSFSKNNFRFLLGQGLYVDNNTSGLTVSYFGLPVDNFDDASLNYDIPAENINASGYEGIQHKVNSLFGRVIYNYDEKYLMSALLRRDGSSRFGANNKFGYFPSFSVGWVASREDFWPLQDEIPYFKLRYSYGVTGNDVLGNFRYISTVGDGRNISFGNNNYIIGYSPDAPSNPDLRWEETSQSNFGVEMNFLEHFNLTADVFNKKTEGILQVVQLPAYVGATGNSFANIADVSNKGFELELGYSNSINEVNFNINGNISHVKNEVLFLGEDKDFLEGGENLQNSTYSLTRTSVGQPIGAFFGFQTNGIFQTIEEVENYVGDDGSPIQPNAQPGDFRWEDINNDGQINSEDRKFLGSPIPDWSYGFNVSANYRQFDMVLFGQGVAGNEIFQGLRRLDIPSANWQVEALDRWTGPGTSNSYPRLALQDSNNNFNNPSNFHLESGNYFRIKTLQLGYSLDNKMIDNLGLNRFRVYFSSNNLVTFTNYTGFDPEIGGNSFGIDRAIYPQARSFLLGLNVEF